MRAPRPDDDAVERGDGGDPTNTPAATAACGGRRCGRPAAARRGGVPPTPGSPAVLQEEEEAQGREGEEDRQRREGLDPVATPVRRAWKPSSARRRRRCSPAARSLRREVGRLARDAPDEHHHESRAQHEQAEEDARSARGPRDPAALEHAHQRRRHRGDHPRDDDGTTIVLVSAAIHVAPMRTAPTPASSHDANPRSLSHCGAEKTPDSSTDSSSTTSGSSPASDPAARVRWIRLVIRGDITARFGSLVPRGELGQRHGPRLARIG
jgi:hypothetical protein